MENTVLEVSQLKPKAVSNTELNNEEKETPEEKKYEIQKATTDVN